MNCLALAAVLSSTPLAGVRICIDPGHPSENGVGTTGRLISELDACWNVSLSLKQYLQDAGATVVLTKTEKNTVVTNRRRAEIGNEFKAHLTLRIHCDAANETGFATFYPHRTGTVQGVTGPSRQVLERSKLYAPLFHRGVMSTLGNQMNDRGVRTEAQTAIGARQGALTGSIFSQVPVLLVEMAVLTQRRDDEWMAKPANQRLMARALSNGVVAIFQRYPVSSTSR
jgi:N-acetylmuramoyl-L-alanine amidase